MAYTCNSIEVFIAAFSGCLGGMTSGHGALESIAPAHYTRLTRTALTFAEAFDTEYAVVLPNELQLADIESVCSESMNGRQPGTPKALTTAFWGPTVKGIIAALSEADTIVAANVTDPIPFPIPITATVFAIPFVFGVTNSLYATTPPFSCCAIVDGYTTKGDNGGGTFLWNPTSIATDDGGTVILPTGHVGAGRWIRIYTGDRTLPFYGIIPNNSAVATLNTTRMNALLALMAGNTGPDIYAPPGIYSFDDQLLFFNLAGMRLHGCAQRGTIFQYEGATDHTKDFILFWGNETCIVENIYFYVLPVAGHVGPPSGFYRLNNTLRVTSAGIVGPGCSRNMFRKCSFQGSYNGLMVGSDTNVDINLDLNVFDTCVFDGFENSGIIVSNSNTNNTHFINPTVTNTGHYAVRIEEYPRGTIFENTQMSNFGALQAGGASAAYFIAKTFGANLVIKDQVWELQENQPMLVVELGSAGVFPAGEITLKNHVVTNNTLSGTEKIIDYQGVGSLILDDMLIAGSAGGGRIYVHPPATPEAGGTYQLITKGNIFLYDGAYIDIDENLMGWVGTKPVTATSLATTDQTATSHVLQGGKNLGDQTRYECIPVVVPVAITQTIKRGSVSSYAIKCTIPYTAFKAVGGATAQVVLYVMTGSAFLDKIQAKVTQAFASPALVTAMLDVGDTTGAGANGYLIAFDATVLNNRVGKLDTDLGPALTRNQALQGGHILSWGAQSQLFIELVMTGDTADNLTAGSVDLWFNFTPLE